MEERTVFAIVGLAALIGAAVYLFRRTERRWRWRWNEVPDGSTTVGDGAYRSQSLLLQRQRAPDSLRLAALVGFLFPIVPLALVVGQMLIEWPARDGFSTEIDYRIVFFAQTVVAIVMGACAWRLSLALLERNAQRSEMRSWVWAWLAIPLGACMSVAEFAPQLSLHFQLYWDPAVSCDGVIWELAIATLLIAPLPIAVQLLMARIFRRELELPSRYIEWNGALVDVDPS